MLEAFSGFVKRVVRALNRSALRYMLTGALASTYYARPRTTLDMDVVIGAELKDLVTLHKWLRKASLRVEEAKLKANKDYLCTLRCLPK